jgi:hypothetical protein
MATRELERLFFLFFSLFICSSFSQGLWTQLNSFNPPSPLYGHTAIYVSTLNSMLIFGGTPTSGGQLNDLWSYDIFFKFLDSIKCFLILLLLVGDILLFMFLL